MYKYRYFKLWFATMIFFLLFAAVALATVKADAAECERCCEYTGNYTCVDRTVGVFGYYIAPAQVTDAFLMQDYENPDETITVYHFTDADGELWIIDETYLAEMCEVPLEVGQEVQIVMDANETPDDFYDDFFHDVFVCYDVLTDK